MNFCKYLSYLAITIAIISAIMVIVYMIFWVRCCCLDLMSCKKNSATDVLMVFLTCLAIFLTLIEYLNYKRRERADVLGLYNERYSRDEHINRVVNYLICFLDKTKTDVPSIHDAEMFMRFYEEMQIQIDEKRIEEEHVYTLFSFYAILLDSNSTIRNDLGITDYVGKDNNWSMFKKFNSNMMKRYRLAETRWQSENKEQEIEINNKGKAKLTGKSWVRYQYESGRLNVGEKTLLYIVKDDEYLDELYYNGLRFRRL